MKQHDEPLVSHYVRKVHALGVRAHGGENVEAEVEAAVREASERIADRVAALLSTPGLSAETYVLGNGSAASSPGYSASVTDSASIVSCSRAIPGARYVEREGCGHAPMIQAPAAFLAVLAGFLKRA